MFLAVATQLAQPVIGLRWLHEFLARASAGCFIVGVLCCCGCALKDRLRSFEGQGSLPAALALYWAALTLVPIGCLASLGALMLLGQQAGQFGRVESLPARHPRCPLPSRRTCVRVATHRDWLF
jgi:hypothetical protein